MFRAMLVVFIVNMYYMLRDMVDSYLHRNTVCLYLDKIPI
jgi:hypothetical protein